MYTRPVGEVRDTEDTHIHPDSDDGTHRTSYRHQGSGGGTLGTDVIELNDCPLVCSLVDETIRTLEQGPLLRVQVLPIRSSTSSSQTCTVCQTTRSSRVKYRERHPGDTTEGRTMSRESGPLRGTLLPLNVVEDLGLGILEGEGLETLLQVSLDRSQ